MTNILYGKKIVQDPRNKIYLENSDPAAQKLYLLSSVLGFWQTLKSFWLPIPQRHQF